MQAIWQPWLRFAARPGIIRRDYPVRPSAERAVILTLNPLWRQRGEWSCQSASNRDLSQNLDACQNRKGPQPTAFILSLIRCGFIFSVKPFGHFAGQKIERHRAIGQNCIVETPTIKAHSEPVFGLLAQTFEL